MSDSERTDETGEDTRRADVIQGIRELADFLESNPAVRPPGWVHAHTYVAMYDEPLGVAELQAVGGEIKVDGHYVEAVRDFGADVTYTAQARAADICIEREVTKSEFVLPEELAPPAPESEMDEVEKTPVTW